MIERSTVAANGLRMNVMRVGRGPFSSCTAGPTTSSSGSTISPSPGDLQGGFNWYIGNAKTRLAVMKGELPKPPVITVPARVLWGGRDPVVKAEWADRLPEYFAQVEVSVLPEAGHFVHYEQPAAAAQEIKRFFGAFAAAS